MDIQNELILSYYGEVAALNQKKNIYLVQHVETQKLYVKKVMDIYNTSVYRQLMNLKTKGIPLVYECFEDDGKLYVIEEYVHGKTLEEIFKEKGVFTEDEITDISLQLCSILRVLHEADPAIIHRDLKPSNLILTSGNVLYLIDYNAAKNYSAGENRDTMLIGTQNFAAPEQYGFSQSDVRTDIYGLGATMNYLLTGKSANEQIYEGKLTAVLQKCLCINPSDRYNSVTELKDAISAAEGSQSGKIALPFNSRIIISIIILAAIIIGIILIFIFRNTIGLSGTSNSSNDQHLNDNENIENIENTDNAENDSLADFSDEINEIMENVNNLGDYSDSSYSETGTVQSAEDNMTDEVSAENTDEANESDESDSASAPSVTQTQKPSPTPTKKPTPTPTQKPTTVPSSGPTEAPASTTAANIGSGNTNAANASNTQTSSGSQTTPEVTNAAPNTASDTSQSNVFTDFGINESEYNELLGDYAPLPPGEEYVYVDEYYYEDEYVEEPYGW